MRAKTAVAITLAGLLIAPALAQLTESDLSAPSSGDESDIPPPTEVIQVPSPPPAPDPVTELPQPTPSPEASPLAPAPEERDSETQGGQDEVEGREDDDSA
jgi:hypothetical protein